MKKILTTLLFSLLLMNFALSQDTAMVVHFFSSTPLTMVGETSSECNFGLTASPGQVDAIAAAIGQWPQKFTFSSKAGTDPAFPFICTLNLFGDTHVQSLHKTLLWLGVSFFTLEGKVYPLNDMLSKIQ